MSTWQDERRANRRADAEIRRADMAADAERLRADKTAEAERRRAERDHADAQRRRDKDAARARRARLLTAVSGWIRAHTIDLLFVPVILVPALLAWSAIAGFGHDLYGAPGWTMPLYSEAAMWAFAFALAAARRAGRPTGRLLVGLWLSAGVSATLACLHGLSVEGGGVVDGVVMALVAVGGVVVHQIVDTADRSGPRKTREQRAALRLQRLADRRVVAVRRAALRHAAAVLAADGTATLVHTPGTVRLHRRLGRTRLVPATVPGLPVADGVGTLGDEIAAQIGDYLTALPAPTAPTGHAHTPGTAETVAAPIDPKIVRYAARVRAAIDGERLPAAPSRTEVQRFLRCRAEHARAVHNVLFPTTRDDGPDEGGTRQEVTA